MNIQQTHTSQVGRRHAMVIELALSRAAIPEQAFAYLDDLFEPCDTMGLRKRRTYWKMLCELLTLPPAGGVEPFCSGPRPKPVQLERGRIRSVTAFLERCREILLESIRRELSERGLLSSQNIFVIRERVREAIAEYVKYRGAPSSDNRTEWISRIVAFETDSYAWERQSRIEFHFDFLANETERRGRTPTARELMASGFSRWEAEILLEEFTRSSRVRDRDAVPQEF